MKTHTEMPYGHRWLTSEEITEYNGTDDHRWGWMNYVSMVVPSAGSNLAGYIRPWDCMIEFDMDHNHDAIECERTMAMMSDPAPDYQDFDYQDAHYERFGRPAFPNEY